MFKATPGSATASVAEEAAAALEATDKDVSIGGAGLAAAAIKLGLVDELRMFRDPVLVGGGTPLIPSPAASGDQRCEPTVCQVGSGSWPGLR